MTSNTPRVLVAITYGFSVRYFLSTGVLDKLNDAVDTTVGLGWHDPELESLLEGRGLEVVYLPEAQMDHTYRMYRHRLDLVHQRRLASPTTKIKRSRAKPVSLASRRGVVHGLRRSRDRLAISRPGGATAVIDAERAQVERGTNIGEWSSFLRRIAPTLVVSATPYHDHDALLLQAARDLGLPSLSSIISFDNPTIRGRLTVRSDRILVWNRYNADEINRSYDDVSPETISVIGAPQFDLHHRADLVQPEAEWRRSLNLPADRPIILYGAGPSRLVPGERELVRMIDRAAARGTWPEKPYLLVRRHPTDTPEQWDDVRESLTSGTVSDPWAAGGDALRSWPTEADISLQVSTLAHSAVHVNICSSMTIDGSLFDRPQIGPVFVPGADRRIAARIRAFYRQEHWQPISRSGGLVLAEDESELVAAIGSALSDPTQGRDGRRRLVEEVLTIPDDHASDRLVAEIVQAGGVG